MILRQVKAYLYDNIDIRMLWHMENIEIKITTPQKVENYCIFQQLLMTKDTKMAYPT
jgi:hypothetical protein